MWWHTMTLGRGSKGETGEWSGYSQYPSHYLGTLLPLMRTPRLPVFDWTDTPRRFKWTRPFRRKTKSVFCACAITFQVQSKPNEWNPHTSNISLSTVVMLYCIILTSVILLKILMSVMSIMVLIHILSVLVVVTSAYVTLTLKSLN